MGYTHYWYRELEINKGKMKAIVDDFAKIVLRLDDMGVHLAGGLGEGVPQIDTTQIWFNGPDNCGHPKNSEISIPWPTPTASGVKDGAGVAAGSWFAGATLETRCCDGSCSYETFHFPRVMDMKGFLQPSERDSRLYFTCCKTAYRPYDLAVTACLVIAKHHLADDVIVSSDGEIQHWAEAIELCRVYLGYEELYHFDGRGELRPNLNAAISL
jgi:hypothetical protein